MGGSEEGGAGIAARRSPAAERTAAPHVNDDDLLAIANRSRGRIVFHLANMIISVCESRRVPQETTKSIAEAWSLRPDRESRQAALDLLDHIPRTSAQKLVEAALRDPHVPTRATAVMQLADLFEREEGLALVLRPRRTRG